MMCPMKIRHELTYDAPVAQVQAMLTDPEFRKRGCDARGVLSCDITVEADEGSTTLVIDQVQPTEGVPAFARKIAGERTRVVLTEEWADDGRASLALHTPGKPTQITGVLTLTQDGARTVEVFEGEARAKVPLIGGKLEALLADMFRAGLDTEHAVGVSWLKGQRG
jgi:uncharacterized protein YndB with AHSA1/START domain